MYNIGVDHVRPVPCLKHLRTLLRPRCYIPVERAFDRLAVDCFRNEKRASQDEEVILHKRKGIEKGAGSSSEQVKKALKRGALRWTPPFPEGEDEVSLKRHMEFLQNECSRRNPDREKIRKRMALTFPMRRRTMNNPRPINDVRSEYPALFDTTEVNTAGINLFLFKTCVFTACCYCTC